MYARVDTADAPGYLTLVGEHAPVGSNDLADAKVTLSQDAYTYTGGPIEPEFTVELGGKTLTPYQDFQFVYDDPDDTFHTDAGTYSTTLEGCGDYTGTITFDWVIAPASIEGWEIHLGRDSWAYTGEPITPGEGLSSYIAYITYNEDGSIADQKIQYHSDGNYDLAWENNVLPGDATIIVTGKNNLTGTIRGTFKINNVDIRLSAIEKRISARDNEYTGEPVRPTMTLRYKGETLVEGTDYKLTYPDPDAVNVGSYYVRIDGMGIFGNTEQLQYFIRPKAITADDVTVTFPEESYDIATVTEEAKPQVSVNGEQIAEVNPDNGKTAYTYTFGEVTQPGEVSVYVSLNSQGDDSCNYKLTTQKEAKVIATGKLSDAKVTAEAAVYEGSPVTTKLTVAYNGKKLAEGTDYEIVGYENNDRQGTAKVTIKGVGFYTGTATASFLITGDEPFFDDVNPADVTNHGAEVEWMGKVGISQGWETADGGHEFRGTKPVARCDFAAFLYRLADLADDGGRNDSPKLTDAEVADVLEGVSDCTPRTDHAMEVAWMISSGISRGWQDKGKSTVSFRPRANVARQDMAAFLYRFADVQDDGEQNRSLAMGPEQVAFSDVRHGDEANHAPEVEWLASVGVTKGWDMKDGTYQFRGTNNVARQDMAAFLYRLYSYLNG